MSQGPNENLAKAADAGDLERVLELLTNPDININEINSNGYTPLMLAARKGYVPIVRVLLADPRIDLSQAQQGSMALILAVEDRFASRDRNLGVVVELISDSRIDINGADSEGNTALIWASVRNSIVVVHKLLDDAHIDVNILNNDGDTALTCARAARNTDVVRVLSQHSADPNFNINSTDSDAEVFANELRSLDERRAALVSTLAGRPDLIATLEENDDFICPVSGQLIVDPVRIDDGSNRYSKSHAYERLYIERWVREHRTNPLNREPCRIEQIQTAPDVRSAISAKIQELSTSSHFGSGHKKH